MCILCKEKHSYEHTVNSLKEALQEPHEFALWNTTSLAFVLYSAIGIDGMEGKARILGLKLLEKFSRWVNNQPAYYLPDTGMEPMYHPKVIEKLYLLAKNFTNPNNLSKHDLYVFLGTKLNEYKNEQKNNEMINIRVVWGLSFLVGYLVSYHFLRR